MSSDQETFRLDSNRLTSIRCTLADLQLVHTVLIDVTVSVSRDYGILTTGIYDTVSLDAIEQFEYSIQELKNIAMQLKQNTGWVTVKETPRKRKAPIPKSHSRRKRRSRRSSGSSGEESDSNPVSESIGTGEQEDNINTDRTVCDINQSVTNQTSDSFIMTCETQPDRLPTQSDVYEIKLEPPEVLDTDDVKEEETAIFTCFSQQQYFEPSTTETFIGSRATSTQPSSDEQLHQLSMTSTSGQSYTSHQLTNQSYIPSTSQSDIPSHFQTYKSTELSVNEDEQKDVNGAHPMEFDWSNNALQPSTSQGVPGDDDQSYLRNFNSVNSQMKNKCRVCGKTFLLEAVLLAHLRSHTMSEKPFKCEQCKKCFTLKATLSRHIKIHIGEKPFKCCHCEKSFNRKVNLETHVRTHTGEKPFKCIQCGKCFSDQSSCGRHMRNHLKRDTLLFH